MEEKEFRVVHEFYAQVADYFEVDLEDTEYYEHGTYPSHVHKEIEDHKEAIRLLSKVLDEKAELSITYLESWEEDYEYSSWADRYSRISDSEYDVDEWDNPVGK